MFWQLQINKASIIAVLVALTLSACSMRTEFEDYAYQGCVKEGKYPDKICACNAKNLDQSLTDNEKLAYKKATLGNLAAGIEMLGVFGKLTDALQKCAE